ncbi:MAG TPA: tetratricopeptide repeat protein [Candidatus Krumholzibacteria bacterium]|nr:tetratricopeptide repeat protein [Candidatus Krumholzibacteria bacterium]
MCALSCSQAADRTPARSLSEQLSGMTDEERLTFLRDLDTKRPGDATVAFQLGNTYYSLGSASVSHDEHLARAYYDSAVAEYKRAVGTDSTYSKAYVNMGLAYEAAGNKADARRVLQQAVAVNPNDVLAHCHLGQLEQSNGNYADAVKLYQRALELDPNSAQAHYNLGLAFAENKVFREAMIEWERVMVLDRDGELGKTAAENVRMIRQYVETEPASKP